LASKIDYKLDSKSVISNIRQASKIICIANPNNPTGTYLNKNELIDLINKIPSNIVIIIDTAYAELADDKDYDNTFELTEKYENVLITRTFSKAYSLASMRLRWGYGSKNLINIIKKVRPPFNLPPGTIAAGIAALYDDHHLNNIIEHNSSITDCYISDINNIGYKAYNTHANSVVVIIPDKSNRDAYIVNDFLLSKGIAVRYLAR
jgi:Histidinol-phosphate/aromatic aminotransferase and cobyric acid decarboxylase